MKEGIEEPAAHLNKELKKVTSTAYLLFIAFYCFPESSLDLYFHPLISEFFNLPSYKSESRKRYILGLLILSINEQMRSCDNINAKLVRDCNVIR